LEHIIRGVEETRPAGFWIRAAAAALDLGLVVAVERSFQAVARLTVGSPAMEAWGVGSTVALFALLFAAAYATVLHALDGQTVGKLLMGVRVVSLAGGAPTGGQAFLRWLGYWASLVPVGLGYLMAGLRADKRALHDLLAGTRVVRVRSVPGPVPAAEATELVPPIG
jgi:uncharacterized RDD family membrane protein YckC